MTASAQFLDGDRRHAVSSATKTPGRAVRCQKNEASAPCARLGVDRFPQVQPGVDVAKEELRDPLVMLITARLPQAG
jgi:hypothetical protein